MSILVGWQDPSSREVWIGSDRMICRGDTVLCTDQGKWRVHEGWAFGCAGDPFLADLAEQRMQSVERVHLQSAGDFAEDLRSVASGRGWNFDGGAGQAPYAASTGLLVFGGALYEVHIAQGWAREVTPGQLAAVGSGHPEARGAWHALENLRLRALEESFDPRECLYLALEASIALDVYCGGEPWVTCMKATTR